MPPTQSPDNELLKSQLVGLTRDLVLIESTDAKPEERHRCFQLVRNHLDEVPRLNLKTYESFGYESLVALPEGIDIPAILFCAHLDVVEHSGPEHYRSKIEEGRIYGPGSGDMKGALAIILTLFRHLLRELPGASLGLAITSDEERGGEHGARFLVEEIGLRAGSVIIPDGGSIDRITVEEKGILHLRVKANGEAAHAARPWFGRNPIPTLIAALKRLEERFDSFLESGHPNGSLDDDDHWYPTCTVTGIVSPHESVNCIPDWATANLDIRFPPPHTAESVLREVTQSLGESVQVEKIIGAEPTHLDPDPVFRNATEEVLQREPRLVRVSGGSDARFFREYRIPVMLSRPIVGNLHGQNEWIDIQSMVDYYRICERYIKDSLH